MLELYVIEDNPWIIRAFATALTREKGEWQRIQREKQEAGIEACREYVSRIYQKFGHLITIEFGNRAIVMDGISRISALYTWRNINVFEQIYGSGLERSLRIQEPPFVCADMVAQSMYEGALGPYLRAEERGVPIEDRRYFLPEGICTTMVLNFPYGSERYFAKLANSYRWSIKEHTQLRDGLKSIVEKELGFFPQEKPVSTWELKGEFEEEKSVSLNKNPFSSNINLSLDASLSLYAQLVRNRMGNTEIEPILQTVSRANYEIPPSFDVETIKEYKELAEKATRRQIREIEIGNPNFVYYTLLGQKARGVFHINGPGAKYVARERACGAAQWEIRNKVGIPLAKMLNSNTKCYEEKKCTEPFANCLVKKDLKKLSIEKVFERLQVPLSSFHVENDFQIDTGAIKL